MKPSELMKANDFYQEGKSDKGICLTIAVYSTYGVAAEPMLQKCVNELQLTGMGNNYIKLTNWNDCHTKEEVIAFLESVGE